MKLALAERLRGARRFGWYAALAAASALLLIATRGVHGPAATQQSPLEARLQAILSRIDGVGSVSVMIAEDADGNVAGAVVVAPELRGVRAYLDVQSAVRTLLGIDLDRIRIIAELVAPPP